MEKELNNILKEARKGARKEAIKLALWKKVRSQKVRSFLFYKVGRQCLLQRRARTFPTLRYVGPYYTSTLLGNIEYDYWQVPRHVLPGDVKHNSPIVRLLGAVGLMVLLPYSLVKHFYFNWLTEFYMQVNKCEMRVSGHSIRAFMTQEEHDRGVADFYGDNLQKLLAGRELSQLTPEEQNSITYEATRLSKETIDCGNEVWVAPPPVQSPA